MRRHQFLRPVYAVHAIAIIAGLVSLSLHAGPILSPQQKTAEMVASLHGLEQVQLLLMPVPEALLDAGVSEASLKKILRSRLIDAGFDLLTDEQAAEAPADIPQVEVHLVSITDQNIPDAVGFMAILSVTQPVMVERLERRLYVPTYSHYTVGIERLEKLAEVVEYSVDRLVLRLQKRVIEADQAG